MSDAETDLLRRQLMKLIPARTVVVAEAECWAVSLPAVALAGEGDSLEDAVADLIGELRFYADFWNEKLFEVSNHRHNWPLVVITEFSDDSQLKDWILADVEHGAA